MREVEVAGTKVLLVHEAGEYHAIGAKCSHYGAPLVKGQWCPHPTWLSTQHCQTVD